MVRRAREPKFELGRVVGTPGAIRAMALTGQGPAEFLDRHAGGDWGDVDADDKKANDDDLAHGGRLLSAYRLKNNTKIWIITEWDRSQTTILLPDEY
jgi:hypothetical protein